MIEWVKYSTPQFIQSCKRYMNFSRMLPFNYDPATAYTITGLSVATS